MAQGTVQPLWLLVLKASMSLNQPNFDFNFAITLKKSVLNFLKVLFDFSESALRKQKHFEKIIRM